MLKETILKVRRSWWTRVPLCHSVLRHCSMFILLIKMKGEQLEIYCYLKEILLSDILRGETSVRLLYLLNSD